MAGKQPYLGRRNLYRGRRLPVYRAWLVPHWVKIDLAMAGVDRLLRQHRRAAEGESGAGSARLDRASAWLSGRARPDAARHTLRDSV